MLRLTPIIDTQVKRWTENGSCHALLDALGSPLNVLFPEAVKNPITSFQETLKKNAVRGHIYFACKANKSQAILRQMYAEGVNVDTASFGELNKTLACGFSGNRIEATGPKNDIFLLLALQHDCLIAVDSMVELERIICLARSLKKTLKTRVLLRMSGFTDEQNIASKDSRFGIPLRSREQLLSFLDAHRPFFDVRGVSFHLDTAAIREKIAAVEHAAQFIEELIDAGWNPSILNIGGGFRMNYLENPKEWHAYIAALQQAVMGKEEPVTWNNTGFGYRNDQGTLKGSPAYYEYATANDGAKYLDEILSAPMPSKDCTIGTYLSERMLELAIEPGRALLNQAGITLAKVNFVKESPEGHTLVGLDMNRSNLASMDQEMFLDPVIIPRKAKEHKPAGSHGVFFVGNLCLEGDFIYRHKTFLPHLPEVGDTVAFINTAAYNSDFGESNTLEQRIARKIAVIPDRDNFRWFLDEEYSPYSTHV